MDNKWKLTQAFGFLFIFFKDLPNGARMYFLFGCVVINPRDRFFDF